MTQTFITIPIDEWNRTIAILERVEKLLEPKDEWIGTKEACKMLGISPNTLMRYRKKFNIKCSQVGRNILMLRSSIEKVLKERSL